MAAGPAGGSAAEAYRPNRYVSLPAELDPATYDASPEKRRAEAERLAIRARLKRQYQLQLNDPHRPAVIEDPALIRWAYARTQNVYPTFRPTPKTSFLGVVSAVGPILFWIYVFKADRDRKEKLIQEGYLPDNKGFSWQPPTEKQFEMPCSDGRKPPQCVQYQSATLRKISEHLAKEPGSLFKNKVQSWHRHMSSELREGDGMGPTAQLVPNHRIWMAQE
uniref:NADH dehydrogenase [ubiquinone] 1 beta subcomplex subunit 4 n=1 Tax=Apteryx owenii TaxID=8824 RepID=A0A8B9Q2F3_APTOW